MDFTRTAESVAKTGADLTKWAKQQETKVRLDTRKNYVFTLYPLYNLIICFLLCVIRLI